jgi:hypothetical protein
MKKNGGDQVLQAARSALLDALEALSEHRESVIVIGAQAIYLHTGSAEVALAPTTKDSDLALDSRTLAGDPRLQDAMEAANFYLDPVSRQPGAWLNPQGIPVDLLVPEALAGSGSRRSGKIPPHDDRATRRAVGLEAAVIDNSEMEIHSLSSDDSRVYTAKVAGPAALLVAKLHKLGERQDAPRRLEDKDAHDIYRLLVAIPTDEIATVMKQLVTNEIAGPATRQALVYLRDMFAQGAEATGSAMAGRAEAGVGEPETVAASVAVLAADLLQAME